MFLTHLPNDESLCAVHYEINDLGFFLDSFWDIDPCDWMCVSESRALWCAA